MKKFFVGVSTYVIKTIVTHVNFLFRKKLTLTSFINITTIKHLGRYVSIIVISKSFNWKANKNITWIN